MFNSYEFSRAAEVQADMLTLFVAALDKTRYQSPARWTVRHLVYLDDVSFSGNRIRNDLRQWIANTAPQSAKVHIAVMAHHRGGQFYADSELKKAAKAARKEVEFTWWRGVEVKFVRAKCMRLTSYALPSFPMISRKKLYCWYEVCAGPSDARWHWRAQVLLFGRAAPIAGARVSYRRLPHPKHVSKSKGPSSTVRVHGFRYAWFRHYNYNLS